MSSQYSPSYRHGRWTRYHYSLLNDRQKDIFKRIKMALNDEQDHVFLPGATKADLPFKIFIGVLNDYPLFYWVRTEIRYTYSSAGITMYFKFNEHFANHRDYDDRLMKLSTDLYEREVKDLGTEYEVELFIHDYLASTIVYDKSDESTAHCLLGPLLHGRGVCDGISDAFNYLMSTFGLFASTINGHDPDAPVGHAWNIVLLDGHFYHMDVTHDLYVDGVPSHAYMNMDDEMAQDTHKYKCQARCDCLDYNPYYMAGAYFRRLRDAEEYLLRRLNGGDKIVEVYTDESTDIDHIDKVVSRSRVWGTLGIHSSDSHRFTVYRYKAKLWN